MKIIEGHLTARNLKFGIVISRFNELVTGHLLNGARDALIRHGAKEDHLEVIRVPGAFEIPAAARKAVLSNRYDAVICLSAIIRGDTPHFDYIAAETTKGIASVGLNSEIPVTFGVITADTLDQALERAGSKSGNKGWDAALSAIEMADLYTKMKS
ncbi:6,7-dimethyl-8-ribityllumazine synthase [bacterium]|nr:6,7-dimethyl-8-ribityllumazine synthase [candidate division CSSED10-310 bacterium]